MELEWHQLQMPYAGLRIRSPKDRARWAATLLEQGQRDPVLVVACAEGRYVLIDGYARAEALRRLGRDTVEAVVLPFGEREALLFSYGAETNRSRSALEEGWLLRELKDRHGMDPRGLAQTLGRSPSWVSRRLGLVRALPESIQDRVRRGRSARMRRCDRWSRWRAPTSRTPSASPRL